MELDRKKTGVIIVATAAAVGLVLIVVAAVLDQKKKNSEEEKIVNVFAEHPDAEVPQFADSKMESYRSARNGRSNVESYWDEINELEGSGPEEDPMADISRQEPAVHSSARDFMSREKGSFLGPDKPSSDIPNAKPSGAGRVVKPTSDDKPLHKMTEEEKLAFYTELQRQSMEDVIGMAMQMQNPGVQPDGGTKQEEHETEKPEKEEEPVRVETEKAIVRRSGGISTLDDSFSDGGVSSLDEYGDDFGLNSDRPFKCMFVKEEKIETGQRVSVRLLEDMVISGTLVPKNTHLMAVCTLGNRLDLKVTSIEMNGRIYSMNYVAYDTDGTKGIYCPDVDMEARNEAKRGGMSLTRRSTSLMGSIASDVANIGMAIAEKATDETRKSVKVPSGYVFYLVNAGKDN